MYHSVNFGSKNSYSDWHLVPESRPVIAMPEPKITTVDIPGRNGVLDLSDAVRGYVTYNNRTGSLTFHVLNDCEPWQVIYREVANYLHGKKMKMTLEDDPGWYYYGRFTVNEWTSNNDGTWSDIEIGYDLEPYKYSVITSTSNGWLWDPFSFKTGHIDNGMFKEINVVSYGDYLRTNFNGYIGSMPLTPKFIVNSSRGIEIKVYNKELGIEVYKHSVTTGVYEWPEIILSEFTENNKVFAGFAKSSENDPDSVVSIEFRIGVL